MKKSCFLHKKGDPSPLRVQVERRIRFEETDQLAMVWHGRYASFFEDVRSAAGDRYGIGYMDFYRNGIVAPIRIMHIDYHHPLRFNETITIEGILHWTEAARINIEYHIRNSEGRLSTTGHTVQVFIDQNTDLLLIPPPFYQEFREKWRRGLFS
jgi:acyl-CoA thioester hydrolase